MDITRNGGGKPGCSRPPARWRRYAEDTRTGLRAAPAPDAEFAKRVEVLQYETRRAGPPCARIDAAAAAFRRAREKAARDSDLTPFGGM